MISAGFILSKNMFKFTIDSFLYFKGDIFSSSLSSLYLKSFEVESMKILFNVTPNATGVIGLEMLSS